MLKTQTATHARQLPALMVKVLFSTVLFSTALYSRPVIANNDVLTLVPEDALGFAVVNRLSDVSEKLGKHTQNLKLPLPDLLMM